MNKEVIDGQIKIKTDFNLDVMCELTDYGLYIYKKYVNDNGEDDLDSPFCKGSFENSLDGNKLLLPFWRYLEIFGDFVNAKNGAPNIKTIMENELVLLFDEIKLNK